MIGQTREPTVVGGILTWAGVATAIAVSIAVIVAVAP